MMSYDLYVTKRFHCPIAAPILTDISPNLLDILPLCHLVTLFCVSLYLLCFSSTSVQREVLTFITFYLRIHI